MEKENTKKDNKNNFEKRNNENNINKNNNESNIKNDNINHFSQFIPLNNQISNNSQNNNYNNLYHNYFLNAENQIFNHNNIKDNKNNYNDINYNNNNFNYNKYNNNNQIFREYDMNKSNNNINENNNNYDNLTKINQDKFLQNQSSKNKFIQKRTNYIPKNLITFSSQNNNQNNPPKLSQDNYMNLPNLYYNNILTSEFKNSFDSHNSNQKKNLNNIYNNSVNNEIDKNYRNIINDINVNSKENEDNDKNNDDIVFKAFTHIFDTNLNDVKEILTDNLFFKNVCPASIIDNVQFTLNNFSDKVGNTISFRWKKFYTLELICNKAFSSKNYAFYTLKLINLKPVNIGNLQMTFKYYYNTCENNTLFIIEYLLDKGILSEVFKEEFLDIDMKEICKSCQKVINQIKKESTHLSSIFFKSSKEDAWDAIMNLNKKQYINYMNEYDLEFYSKNNEKNENNNNNIEKENYIQKGDIIIVKRKKNTIFAKLLVEDIKIEKEKNEIIISCEDSDDDTKREDDNNSENNNSSKTRVSIIKQKIYFSIKKIKKNICFCEFKHLWREQISDQKIIFLNYLKNKSLMLFKRKIEDSNDKILKIQQDINNDKNYLKKNKNIELNKDDNNDNEKINFFYLLCPVKK